MFTFIYLLLVLYGCWRKLSQPQSEEFVIASKSEVNNLLQGHYALSGVRFYHQMMAWQEYYCYYTTDTKLIANGNLTPFNKNGKFCDKLNSFWNVQSVHHICLFVINLSVTAVQHEEASSYLGSIDLCSICFKKQSMLIPYLWRACLHPWPSLQWFDRLRRWEIVLKLMSGMISTESDSILPLWSWPDSLAGHRHGWPDGHIGWRKMTHSIQNPFIDLALLPGKKQ